MDQRERFEAWSADKGRRFNEGDLTYCKSWAWAAWQAAEAALLGCACEPVKFAVGRLIFHGHEGDAKNVAEEWRKLAAPVERGGDKS